MKQLISWTWWKARPKIWASHATMFFVSLLSIFFFRVCNRMRVIGRENIPLLGCGILILPIHITMWDSFALTVAWLKFSILTRPARPPLHFADERNYFAWYSRWLLKLLRAVPVRSRNSIELIGKYEEYLETRNLMVFPQGTRSYDETRIKRGVALFICTSKIQPIVIPSYHEGMDKIFTRGGPGTKNFFRWIPTRIGQEITVIFGRPIDFSDLRSAYLQASAENRRVILEESCSRISESIQKLKSSLRESKTPVHV